MFIAKWYTRASRVRIVIAKFDGRWKLPGGPYTIPELVALIIGILATLFALPRLGQPLLTAVLGITMTIVAVTSMRMMPYSPVNFGTRVHRIIRLYTSPISFSTGDLANAATTVSTVRPQIDILDLPLAAATSRPRPAHHSAPAPHDEGWTDMFGPQRSAAADLFT
jgi:hypothetical protein